MDGILDAAVVVVAADIAVEIEADTRVVEVDTEEADIVVRICLFYLSWVG